MGKKFYAVKKGHKTGIFTTWEACKQQVSGFSGAVYKSFKTEHEAQAFLSDKPAAKKTPEQRMPSGDAALAYVDGSYSDATKEFSYGVVLFHKNMELRLAEKFSDPSCIKMRNVAGEIKGAEKAMRYCLEKGIKEVEIVYDYEGIERWCTGEWKANKPGTIAYKEFYDSLADRLNVTFRKVKGHSGDTFNDVADQLARSALGL